MDFPTHHLSCRVCKKRFKSRSGLYYHLGSHGPQNLECQTCNKTFYNPNGLKQHLKTHEQNKNFCPYCGKSFSKPYWLSRHVEVIHQHKRSSRFQCEVCGKRCSSKGFLISHLSTHSSTHQHECQKCGKGYAYMSSLKRHVKYFCSVDKQVNKIEIKTPVELQCDVCKKEFSLPRLLKQHQRIHMEPTYICDICGKKFKWKKCLTFHNNKCKR